jgi:type I restriction enzyme, S subunit
MKLGEVAKVYAGSAAPQGSRYFATEGEAFIRAADLGRFGRTTALAETRDHLSEDGSRLRGLVRARAGTTLFPKSGAAVATNNRALLAIDAPFVSHLMAVEPREHVEPLWVYHWLSLIDMMKYSDNEAYPSVKQSVAADIILPIPSVAEQRRITIRLGAAMSDIAAGRAALIRQRKEVMQLHDAAIDAALGGRVVAAANDQDAIGANWIPLSDVARLESGHTPSRKHPEWWNGDVPWISLPDIRALDGRTAMSTSERTNALGLAHSSARLLPAGTVVLSRTASVGFVTVMGVAMATSQDFVNWVPGDRLRSWYLAHALIAAREYVRALAEGAIHKTIYMPTLQHLRIRLPTLAEQDHTLARIAQLKVVCADAIAALDRQTAALDALSSALLTAAFQGQL